MYILAVIAIAIVGFLAWCVYTVPRGEYDEEGNFYFEPKDDKKGK